MKNRLELIERLLQIIDGKYTQPEIIDLEYSVKTPEGIITGVIDYAAVYCKTGQFDIYKVVDRDQNTEQLLIALTQHAKALRAPYANLYKFNDISGAMCLKK